MLITADVVWSLGDFAVAGVLLSAFGVALELAVRKAGKLATAIGIAAVGIAPALETDFC
jgi:pyruvate/2-oxoglutarate/acetoin dehydrogenase E1 component